MFLAFAGAGCSKNILQQIRSKQTTITCNRRQVALDFEYDDEWLKSPKFRDALCCYHAGPLAFVETGAGADRFIVNRMCPKCYCGPMAEKECGNVRTHHRERRTGTGQHGAFVNDNSCKKCGWLGNHIREYPLYNPRLLDPLSPADVARSRCAQFLSQGFDECLQKIPTVSASVFEELPLGNSESLKTALNTARTAVVRYYLSTLTAAPHAASSFGGTLWRALESFRDNSDSNRLSAS